MTNGKWIYTCTFLLILGCGLKQSFTLAPVTESFNVNELGTQAITVRPAIDLLWVVDNSPSMATKQAKLVAGLDAFNTKYLKANLANPPDLKLGVITTDTYLAGRANSQCANAGSNYPANYAQLLSGVADGPRPKLNAGPRSGVPIVTTVAPPGADIPTYIDQAITNFKINAQTSEEGSGDERGMESIVQFIQDSELRAVCQSATPDPSCFFRKKSVRGIVIVSDENDNSLFPGSPKSPTFGDGNPLSTDTAISVYNVNYFKNAVDSFFKNLDGDSNPNYFVAGIIQPVGHSDCSSFCVCYDGKKYQNLVSTVGQDSANALGKFSSMVDVNGSGYDTLLDSIGTTITQTVTTVTGTSQFNLSRAPNASFQLIVSITDPSGKTQVLDPSQYLLTNSSVQLKIDPKTLPLGSIIHVTYTPLGAR